MPLAQPHVSVVIPTINRPDLLLPAVKSVLANNYAKFDVIVIDQSTDERTMDAVRELQAVHTNLVYLHTDVAGAARARNLGYQNSTGSIVAYLDDDCVAPDGWIASIVAAFDYDPTTDMIYGRVVAPESLADRAHDIPTLPIPDPLRWVGRQHKFRIYGMSANLAVRRQLFERIGGFDEVMGVGAPLASGEDFDFQYRAYLSRAVVWLRPEVCVEHYGLRDETQWPTTMRRYGVGDGAFYLKHIRCGDRRVLGITIRTLGAMLVREVLSTLGLRRRWSRGTYLRACWQGMLQSLRYPIDRNQRLYQACSH